MRAVEAISAHAWAILPDALHTMLGIAARDHLDPAAVAAQLGRPLDNTHTVTVRDGVAVIPVQGPLFHHAGMLTEVSGATSYDTLATDFAAALADPQVRAVVFDIDSPGGEASGVHELAEMLYAARGTKPTVAYVGGMGCSAAYWLASACDRVVADATAILGSIGTVLAVPAPDGKPARDITFVSSQSPHKRADPTTEAGAAQYQRLVDDLSDVFIGTVARNRGVDASLVPERYGRGGVLVGRHAHEAGLADALGSFESVLADLRQSQRPRLAAASSPATFQGDPVKLKDVFAALFAGAQEAGIEIEPEAAEATATPAQAAQLGPQANAEAEALRARVAQLEAEAIRTQAEAFADGEIRASRAVPAERAHLAGQYVQAASDDAAHGGTRVETLKAAAAARPAHGFAQALLPGEKAVEVLANPQQTAFATDGEGKPVEKPMDETRRAKLLAMTSTGQAVLKERQGKK